MKNNKLFNKMAASFCAMALFLGQISSQAPCYCLLYQPKFPKNSEKLKMK